MRIALAITSVIQLCLWGFTFCILVGERPDFWETLNATAMIVAATVTLALAFVARFPRWLGILGAIAHGAAILTYFAPGLLVGGEYLEGIGLMIGFGLFIPYLIPAAISAALVLSLSFRRPA